MEDGDAPVKVEPVLSRVARVEKEDASDRLAKRFVSVAKDNYGRFVLLNAVLQRNIQRVRIDDVVNQKLLVGQLNGLGQSIPEPRVVGVTANSGDRRDLFELEQDARLPDVASMQNMVDPREELGNLRVEEIVSIRNDTESHAIKNCYGLNSGHIWCRFLAEWATGG